MGMMSRSPNDIGRPVFLHVRSGLNVTEHRSQIYRMEGNSLILEAPPSLRLSEGQEITIYKATDGGETQEYQTTIQSFRRDELLETEVLHSTIPQGFAIRSYFRADSIVAVTLLAEGQKTPSVGNMLNLSGNGIRLAVELVEPERPQRGDPVEVEFSLPRIGGGARVGRRRRYQSEPTMDELKFLGTVIRRHESATDRRLTVFGIMFDEQQFVGSPDKEDDREKLVRYVLQIEFQQLEQRLEES